MGKYRPDAPAGRSQKAARKKQQGKPVTTRAVKSVKASKAGHGPKKVSKARAVK